MFRERRQEDFILTEAKYCIYTVATVEFNIFTCQIYIITFLNQCTYLLRAAKNILTKKALKAVYCALTLCIWYPDPELY